MSTDTLPPTESATRSPAGSERSAGEKGYYSADLAPKKEEVKEESAPSPSRDEPVEQGRDRKDAPPDDCGGLRVKTKDAENGQKSPRNCAQDETADSPASSSRTPLSPQYRHIEPHPQSWPPRAAEHQPGPPHPHEQNGAPHWYQVPDGAYAANHEPHGANVRLPGIAALLTEPYSPHSPHSPHSPAMPRMAAYDDRQADWAHAHGHPHPHPHAPQPSQMAAPPEHYPPMVAALPLDDSRARTPQPMPQRKRGRLPKETTDFLKAWLHSHAAHPYPSEIEKKQMCHATGLSMSQVSNWMINGRRRILGPSYLSTSRSNSNPQHSSPAVQLSSPPVVLQSPSVMLSNPGPALMLRTPSGHQS